MRARVSRIVVIASLVIAFTTAAADARDVKVLHAFKGGRDGGLPTSGLIADGLGNFFGTTRVGGKGNCGGNGCGAVFKIDTAGKKKILYAFKGKNDGGEPVGSLAIGADGSLYGANQVGGGACGCGTVFQIRPDDTEKTLHQFQAGTDGSAPRAGVILDADGNVYGTTQQGGSNACQTSGCGTVYRLTPDGTETILHAFSGGTDGAFPGGGLVFDSAGNLYGTTESGGSERCSFECGTLFEITPSGTKSVVHNFGVDIEDGGYPIGELTFDNTGTLWGTTLQGGDHVRGSLYRVAPGGKEKVVWAFGGFQDGAFPGNGVVSDGAGNLYGALPTDGSGGPGMIFKWSAADQIESIVYAFPPLPAGRGPGGVLAFDAAGNIYGVTGAGGGNHATGCDPNGCGEVYKLRKAK